MATKPETKAETALPAPGTKVRVKTAHGETVATVPHPESQPTQAAQWKRLMASEGLEILGPVDATAPAPAPETDPEG